MKSVMKTMIIGIALISTDALQASYFARIAAYSKQIQQAVQRQAEKISDTFTHRDMNDLKKQLNDIFKDSPESAKADFVERQGMQQAGQDRSRKSIHLAKAGLFGKAESVVIENIQINNHGLKSFSECYFEWLQNGGQKRALAVGVVIGVVGGYAISSYNNKQPLQPQPQTIVVQVPSSQQ